MSNSALSLSPPSLSLSPPPSLSLSQSADVWKRQGGVCLFLHISRVIQLCSLHLCRKFIARYNIHIPMFSAHLPQAVHMDLKSKATVQTTALGLSNR